MLNLLLKVSLFQFLYGLAYSQCDGTFKFASYYGDHMVLQRAPANPVIWGYAAEVGKQVEVGVNGETANTTTFLGPEGVPIWSVKLLPRDPEVGPVVITAQYESCFIALTDVLFGDVYVCSGQSNMVFRMDRLDNPEPDIADAINYPNIRTFQVAQQYYNDSQYDLNEIERPWTIPDDTNMASFSSICWLFGRDINVELGIPLGLIQSTHGGTRIEAWSSPEILGPCYPNGTEPGENPQDVESSLWNGMIHPLLRMPIFGVLWYQGEANQPNAEYYNCSMIALVKDWRRRWFEETEGATDELFPFGQVQLGPNSEGDAATNTNIVRWGQTANFGYTPNPDMEKVFTAVAMDQPDYDSPYGSTHYRYKRPIAKRLTYGAYQLAYGMTDKGPYQGPLITTINANVSSIEVIFDDGNANIEVRSNDIFELCCREALCDKIFQWDVVNITSFTTTSVTLNNVCEGEVTGFRYAWRKNPCERDMCAVYSMDNQLPAWPYTTQVYQSPQG